MSNSKYAGVTVGLTTKGKRIQELMRLGARFECACRIADADLRDGGLSGRKQHEAIESPFTNQFPQSQGWRRWDHS